MGIFGKSKKELQEEIDQLNEQLSAFKPKAGSRDENLSGEGISVEEAIFGKVGLSSFNLFYNSQINKSYKTNRERINSYREMAQMTEISDILEDAVNESTQLDTEGKVINLEIIDKKLHEKENIAGNLNAEFTKLFNTRIKIKEKIWELFYSYMVDGKCYYERIYDPKNKKKGIINIQQLPTLTMDYQIDTKNGKIEAFYQYLRDRNKPETLQDALKDPDIIVFYPNQLGFICYSPYTLGLYDTPGYLEKAKIPFNQLKLLETSVIIYRIVRAPERLVFRIDTGAMPKDKALAYVEKIKSKMTRKQTYDPSTGQLAAGPEITSMLENYYVPQSADGRGSQIESIGGDAKGFTELDDLYYFARKLFRALKYPQSRVSAGEEKREADIMFGGNNAGEISRDEIKWSKFLERQQQKFCRSFEELFLIHLDFIGMKKQYNLTDKSFRIFLNPPSRYKEQMDQNFMEARYNNYLSMADRSEISRVYLQKRLLKWNEEEIKLNSELLKKDYELGLRKKDEEF